MFAENFMPRLRSRNSGSTRNAFHVAKRVSAKTYQPHQVRLRNGREKCVFLVICTFDRT